ncbi:condensation domain-containing protein [Kitasatospora sp. NPDC001660]
MTRILDWRPEPGEVVEFVPVADRAPVPHDVPASYFQQAHLQLAAARRAAGERQSPWMALVFDLPGRADLDALTDVWQALVRRHEAFRTWYEPQNEPQSGPRSGADLAGFRLPPESLTVRPVRVGDFTSTSDLRDHLHRRIDEQTAAAGRPGLLAGVVRRDTTSTVYAAIDHAYTDAHSMALLFDEIRTRYDAARAGAVPDPAPVPGYLEHNRRERERSRALTPDAPELAAWSDFLAAGDGGFPGFPVDLGTDGHTLLDGMRLDCPVLTGGQAEAFRSYCARHRGGFAAGVFAALALAQREFTGNDSYRVLTAVSTRAYPRLFPVHGWLVNVVPLLFRLPASPGLAGAVCAAQQGFQRARAGWGVPLHRALELARGGGGVPVIPPMISYLDGRGAPGAHDYPRTGATVLTGPDAAAGVSMWFNRFPDRVDLAVTVPNTPQAAQGVPKYLDRVREIILTAATHPAR